LETFTANSFDIQHSGISIVTEHYGAVNGGAPKLELGAEAWVTAPQRILCLDIVQDSSYN
jgi:hypothetical protein